MIGSVTYALIARFLFSQRAGFDMLEYYGFEYLGAGAYRMAYLGPDNVVYKINLEEAVQAGGNASEWYSYCAWRDIKLPDWVYIPAMWLYPHDVLAAEYINEDPYYLDDDELQDLQGMGFVDLHCDNVRYADDRIAVIDLGYSYPLARP